MPLLSVLFRRPFNSISFWEHLWIVNGGLHISSMLWPFFFAKFPSQVAEYSSTTDRCYVYFLLNICKIRFNTENFHIHIILYLVFGVVTKLSRNTFGFTLFKYAHSKCEKKHHNRHRTFFLQSFIFYSFSFSHLCKSN